jgi:putative membrane protein
MERKTIVNIGVIFVRIVGYFFLLMIILFGMAFATLNSASVSVDYYLGQANLPLSLLLVIVFAFGCFVGMLIGIWLLIKTKILNYRLRNRLILVEKEVENLRAIPLQDKV